MLSENLSATLRSFQLSRILLTGVELDLFSAVSPPATAAQVASRLGTDPRATGILLNALVALQYLTKSGELFRATEETARYFAADSPENERLATMHTVHQWDSWSTLTDCVRAGGSVRAREPRARDARWTEAFIAAMNRNAVERAPHVVKAVGGVGVSRLLDVGGGPASYSIAFARAYPELHADLLDKPEVLPIAERHIQEAGLAGRITTRAGDLKTDAFGRGYDLVLLFNICHMLAPEENADLIHRAFDSLVPGGRVVIQEFILDSTKTAPVAAAVFALNMLVATSGGSSYSEDEYARWLESAGFSSIRRIDLPGPTDLIVAARPLP